MYLLEAISCFGNINWIKILIWGTYKAHILLSTRVLSPLHSVFVGLSVSLASLFSEAELSRPRLSSPPGELLSAEGVALALLRRFSDKQLPRASDIQWLVSEKDACGQSVSNDHLVEDFLWLIILIFKGSQNFSECGPVSTEDLYNLWLRCRTSDSR